MVDHLDGEQTDRGGLHLQEVVSSLLSKGAAVQWQSKSVTDDADNGSLWSAFRTRMRDVIESYTIAEQLGATDKMLVSTNPNFPLADSVFSQAHPIAMVQLFQVTWQVSHAFTVRALYTLRAIYVKIPDTVRIQFFSSRQVKKMDFLRAKSKTNFLNGRVGIPFKYQCSLRRRCAPFG